MAVQEANSARRDQAPGVETETESGSASILTYTVGLVLALVLTGASFWAAGSGLIYAPGIPVALSVLAVAQMGVHLVFFLHISSAPDHTNNILALAFGVMVVGLVVGGSAWIISNANHNMMSMPQLLQMQR